MPRGRSMTRYARPVARRLFRSLSAGARSMSLGTPQGRAAAVIGTAGAYGLRRLRYEYSSMKRKRLMSSVKKGIRRATRNKSTNKAVAVSNRVGPFLGSIAATKPVKLVKGSTVYRKVAYKVLSSSDGYAGGHSKWVGGSSVGNQDDNFKVVADAFICHYLKRVKDHRSSRTQDPQTNPLLRIWERAVITFGSVGANISGQTYTLLNADINSMVTALSVQLKIRWLDQTEVPFTVIIEEKSAFTDPAGYYRTIFRDDFCQKAVFTFSSRANFKINNTTTAGTTDGDNNVNVVDANPIDGRIYTFKNRVPIFSPSYLENLDLTIRSQLDEISQIDTGLFQEHEYGVNYGTVNNTNVPDSLHAPPLRPAAVFNNCKTSTKVSFAPGGYKMFSMSYAHSGTLNSLFKHIMRTQGVQGSTANIQRFVSSGSDSFLMCLKPTIRTGGANNLALHTQAEFVYKVNMKAGKPAQLPTVQDIEA